MHIRLFRPEDVTTLYSMKSQFIESPRETEVGSSYQKVNILDQNWSVWVEQNKENVSNGFHKPFKRMTNGFIYLMDRRKCTKSCVRSQMTLGLEFVEVWEIKGVKKLDSTVCTSWKLGKLTTEMFLKCCMK